MPRSRGQMARAADRARGWVDEHPDRHSTPLGRVACALVGVVDAEAVLSREVAAARAAGIPWSAIAKVLGLPAQHARARHAGGR